MQNVLLDRTGVNAKKGRRKGSLKRNKSSFHKKKIFFRNLSIHHIPILMLASQRHTQTQ